MNQNKKFKITAIIPLKNTLDLLDQKANKTYYYKLMPTEVVSKYKVGTIYAVK